VTKTQVGLGNVPNVSTNDQTPTYSDAVSLVTLSSGEKLSIAFAKIKLAITNLINHIGDKSNPHGVTKKQVGLEKCDNTADKDKNIYKDTLNDIGYYRFDFVQPKCYQTEIKKLKVEPKTIFVSECEKPSKRRIYQ